VLGALADRLDDAVVQSIIVRLGDEDMAVRKGALRALTGLVDRLDEEAVQAIVARLGDREVTVRENAL
jgi:HEAT repeat protein